MEIISLNYKMQEPLVQKDLNLLIMQVKLYLKQVETIVKICGLVEMFQQPRLLTELRILTRLRSLRMY